MQRFHFFQDIFIHFPCSLTTGKSRPQKTWQNSTDFPLKEGENRGVEANEREGPFKNNPSFSFTRPGCCKFTAPIKIKSKPSLERIYSVQPPASPTTPQLSKTPGVNLPVPALYDPTPPLTGLAAGTELSITAKLSYRNQRCVTEEEGFFFIQRTKSKYRE